MSVILALGQSGVSNFESVIVTSLERKLRKNALCLNQSAISYFAFYVIMGGKMSSQWLK